MQFMVLGYDGTDEQALERRLAAREKHLGLAAQMAEQGEILYAAAIQDDAGKMIGSMIICEFPSRADLDQWLKAEPYVTGNVWQKLEIKGCQVAPFCKKN